LSWPRWRRGSRPRWWPVPPRTPPAWRVWRLAPLAHLRATPWRAAPPRAPPWVEGVTAHDGGSCSGGMRGTSTPARRARAGRSPRRASCSGGVCGRRQGEHAQAAGSRRAPRGAEPLRHLLPLALSPVGDGSFSLLSSALFTRCAHGFACPNCKALLDSA
jgi:hypothetical protein